MEEPSDHDAWLADALEALGSPVRLRLLRVLRTPKALREIEVRGEEDADGRGSLARQSVRRHLDRLLELRVVEARATTRVYGETQEYVVNHRTLYALGDEVRDLARLRPAVDLPAETEPDEASAPAPREGPCLVVVKGLEEGARFDLRPREGGAASEWVVGRRRGAAVSLDFDPYVSAENALIRWEAGAHVARDLPGSRNGTSVNFRRLRDGEATPLRHGDLLRVGRTHLLYWA